MNTNGTQRRSAIAIQLSLLLVISSGLTVRASQPQLTAKERYDAARREARSASRSKDEETQRLALLRAFEAARDFPPGDRRTLKTLESLAHLCQRLDRHDEAARYLETDLSIRRQVSAELLLDGPAWSLLDLYETLGQLAKAEELMLERIELLDRWRPDDAKAGREARLDLVDVLLNRRPGDPAIEALLQQATDMSQVEDPDQSWKALKSVGWRYEKAGRSLEANELFARALEASDQLENPDLDDLARLQLNLAESYETLGLIEPALLHSERALRLQEQRLGTNHPDLVLYLRRLGILQSAGDLHEDAIGTLERALSIGASAWGERSPHLRSVEVEIERAIVARGAIVAGGAIVASGAEAPSSTARRRQPPGRLDCCAFRERVSELRRQGHLEEAEAVAEQEVAHREVSFGTNSPEVAEALSVLASLHWETDTTRSLELYQRRLRILEEIVDLGDPRVASTAGSLRYLASVLDDYELAETYAVMQLRSYEAGGLPGVKVADALEDLANLRMRSESYEAALEDFRLAAELRVSITGEDTPEVYDLHRRIAWALIRMERFPDAEELLLDQITRLEQRNVGDNLQLRQAVSTLTQLYGKWGRQEDAKVLGKRYPP